jgi:hypothetical protein
MGDVIAEYDGSKPGSKHQITRGNDGVVYCSCWAWRRSQHPRHCKHLDRFFAEVTNKPTTPTPTKVPVQTVSSSSIKSAQGVIDSVEASFWSEEEGHEV